MSNWFNPIKNNTERECDTLVIPSGASTLYVYLFADRNLRLTLSQSLDDEETYEVNEIKQYTANEHKVFEFKKVGEKVYFLLQNTSGEDCTITRAFLDYKNSNFSLTLDTAATLTTSDTISHTKLETIDTTLNGTLDVTGSSVSVSNTVQVANTDLGYLSDINDTLSGTLTTTDATTHTKLDGVKTSVDTINTTLSGTLTTTDATTHTKLTTIDGTLSDIDDRVAEINTTLSGTLTTTDATTHTNLGTINTTLSGTLDVCPILCRPLLVATIFNTSSGTTAVNVLDGALKLVGFSYAHSDNQGCLSFYDVAAASTAPTSTSTALFSVAATTANLSSPTFPTSSYINFENGLWIRLNGNIDPGNTTNEAGTITLYYEV